jgi:ElaB/YqjD/DUF883 family membrane-anchored ribosome-binding protein
MKTETNAGIQTPEEVLNELRSLVLEAEKILGHSTAGNCEGTVAALRERFEAAQERLTSVYENTRRRVAAGAKRTDETIRDNPYQSIAIALGVGMLAGVLLGRRSK